MQKRNKHNKSNFDDDDDDKGERRNKKLFAFLARGLDTGPSWGKKKEKDFCLKIVNYLQQRR